jgi:hypothetical protein
VAQAQFKENRMPKSTVRANARTLPEAGPHPDADLIALANRCIAANERFDVAADAYARAEFASPHKPRVEAEADRAQSAALDRTWELGLPLARMQPSTFDGLLAKAKALKFAIPEGDVMSRIIEEALEEDPFVPKPMSLILARDLIVLADQKDRERAKASATAEIEALAAEFEAAWAAESVIFKGDSTDAEAAAVTARVREVAQKIVALPATDMAMMRLKARVYLWSESTDFAAFAAENEGNGWSESVLVSLFRDLGVAHLETTPGPVTMADRAPAQHEARMNAATPASPESELDRRHSVAFVDLEPKIRDLTRMAELARFHAINTFGSNSPDETEEGKREREIALFAVVHVEEMVRDLEKAYEAGWQTARSSPSSVDEQPRTVS